MGFLGRIFSRKGRIQPGFEQEIPGRNQRILRRMTQPAWTKTDKERISRVLQLIREFENSGSAKHYKANAQKVRIMLEAIKKTLE